jgi:O-antigen ligase
VFPRPETQIRSHAWNSWWAWFSLPPVFIAFHFQTVSIGPTTLDQVQKLVILAIMMVGVAGGRFPASLSLVNLVLGLKAIKSALIVGTNVNLIDPFLEMSRYGTGFIAAVAGRVRPERATTFLEYVVFAVTIFAVPYLVGALDSISSGFDLDMFGGDGSGFVGAFLNPHTAGISHAVCAVYLLAGLAQRRYRPGPLMLALLAINLAAVYFSFARTAWVVLAIGAILPAGVLLVRSSLARLLLPVVVVVVVVAASGSTAVMNRILDINIHHTERSRDLVASGRLVFWQASAEIFAERGLPGMLLGSGRADAVAAMNERIGRPLESHSGFFDALVQQGLIGLVLDFFLVLCLALVSAKALARGDVLVPSLFGGWLFVYALQGGNFFYADIVLFCSVGIATAPVLSGAATYRQPLVAHHSADPA